MIRLVESDMSRVVLKCWLWCLILTTVSCAQRYQIHQLKSIKESVSEHTNKKSASDKLVTVKYDFWAPNGVMLFQISNISNDTLMVLMQRSHIELNGVQVQYWTGAPGDDTHRLKENGLRYSPGLGSEANIVLPPGDAGWFEGYALVEQWMKIRSQHKADFYDRINTPLTLTNHLVFKHGNGLVALDDTFYLSSSLECSQSKFDRIETMNQDKSDKFFVVKEPLTIDGIHWAEFALPILMEILYLL